MDKRALIAAAIATALLAAGCAKKEEAKEEPAAAAPPAVDLAAEEQAIRTRSAEWMNYANAKDAASIANNMMTPDAVTIYDGNVMRGTAAIQAGMEKEGKDMPDALITTTTNSVKVAESGDLAVEFGDISFDPDGAAGKKPATSGSYVTVWEKTDGQWKSIADAGTMDAKKEDEEK
jgi:uncharacterized protein (TIGR02246 family)